MLIISIRCHRLGGGFGVRRIIEIGDGTGPHLDAEWRYENIFLRVSFFFLSAAAAMFASANMMVKRQMYNISRSSKHDQVPN